MGIYRDVIGIFFGDMGEFDHDLTVLPSPGIMV